MSTIGPKNDAARMQQMLARLKARQDVGTDETSAPSAPKKTQAAEKAAVFGADGGRGQALVGGQAGLMPAMQSGGSPGLMNARLAAMTGQAPTSGGPAQTGRLQLTDGPLGKTAVGDIVIATAADLAPLRGVAELRGNLAMLEADLKVGDLAALATLKKLDGSFSVEGAWSLSAISGLGQLAHITGNFYAGYNDALEQVSLPALRKLDAALIIEGNAGLVTFAAPKLEQIGGYAHLHENGALEQLLLGKVGALGGELSVLDNPRLSAVNLGALAHVGGSVEVEGNGADVLQGLDASLVN